VGIWVTKRGDMGN